jgi:hypothetical protein
MGGGAEKGNGGVTVMAKEAWGCPRRAELAKRGAGQGQRCARESKIKDDDDAELHCFQCLCLFYAYVSHG